MNVQQFSTDLNRAIVCRSFLPFKFSWFHLSGFVVQLTNASLCIVAIWMNINRLATVVSMHLSWHWNSSTAITLSMAWPSKTWSQKEEKNKSKILLRQTEKIELKERGGPLNLQMFTYQFEFQKRWHKSLCLPPQITFPGEYRELQRPAELAMNLPSKVLCCVVLCARLQQFKTSPVEKQGLTPPSSCFVNLGQSG